MHCNTMMSTFLCPLSSEIFEDPVVAADGFTYERFAIEDWIGMKGGLAPSPMNSALMLSVDSLTPNLLVTKLKGELIEKGVDISAQLPKAAAQYIIDQSRSGGTILKCPIMSQLMNEPVVYRDGFTYEKAAISEWTLFPEELITNIWYMELLYTISTLLLDKQPEKQSVLPHHVAPLTTADKDVPAVSPSTAPPTAQVLAPEWEDMLCCPISMEIMHDPVTARDGFTYERRHIEDWIRLKHTSPMTSMPLMENDLVPNIILRQIISQYQPVTPPFSAPQNDPGQRPCSLVHVTSNDRDATQDNSFSRRRKRRRLRRVSGAMKALLNLW